MFSELQAPVEDRLLSLEEVQMTAEEDKKHMLSYIGYMALDTRTASGVWKEN